MLYTEQPIVSVFDASVFENEEEFNKAYSEVSESRRKRVDSCRLQKDKRLSLAAGVLLERELRKLGVEPGEIKYGEKGKLYLPDTNIHFNLSHSGDLAACAIFGREVGIDIQTISEVSGSLVKKVTTGREYELLHALKKTERPEMFFRIWTIKESYLKFLGEGLGIAMSRLYVSFGEKISIRQDGEDIPVIFEEYDIIKIDLFTELCLV